MTTSPTTPTPTPKPSIAGITAAIDAHMDGVTDPRILKLHERATAALAALVDALDGHRKAAKVNAEIADLEARLAKARDERAKITGTIPGKRGGSTSLGPGVSKAIRAWAAANGVDAGTIGRVPGAAVDAWRAAGSPTP